MKWQITVTLLCGVTVGLTITAITNAVLIDKNTHRVESAITTANNAVEITERAWAPQFIVEHFKARERVEVLRWAFNPDVNLCAVWREAKYTPVTEEGLALCKEANYESSLSR